MSVSIRIIFLAAAVCLAAVCITPEAVSADCGIGGIQLASLSTQDWNYTDAKSKQWLVRPCAPTTNAACLKEGSLTSACEESTPIAYGFWTTDLWHHWTFLDPNSPTSGVQLYMTGSDAPGCNAQGKYFSYVQFPCAQKQGPLTVIEDSDNCSANFTFPTPLTCRAPLETTLF